MQCGRSRNNVPQNTKCHFLKKPLEPLETNGSASLSEPFFSVYVIQIAY